MKLVTKMRKFVERMENVESMTERQLVEMLFKAEKMMAEHIAAEERKESAYIALKEATNYRAIKTTKTTKKVSNKVLQETLEETATIQLSTTEEEEQILDNGGYIEMNEDVLSRLNFPGFNVSQGILNQQAQKQEETKEETKLVITKESEDKGLLIGAYHKDGAVTYFSSSSSYDYPVVFGNPALTTEIKDSIVKQKPDFYQPVTKNFKSIAMFGKSDNKQAMVYLADAKRLVFEGYIGDMVFSTSKSYLDKDYSPLVTRADIFIRNGGKHNHVADNMCTPSLKKLIIALIEQYMISSKFAKARNDIEYFNRLKSHEKQQQYQVVVEHKPQVQAQNLGYGLNDIYAAMQSQQSTEIVIGGVNYEPEF